MKGWTRINLLGLVLLAIGYSAICFAAYWFCFHGLDLFDLTSGPWGSFAMFMLLAVLLVTGRAMLRWPSTHAAKLGAHTIEVEAMNQLTGGVSYRLYFDEREVAALENPGKFPRIRRVEAQVEVESRKHLLVLEVHSGWFNTAFDLSVDGDPVDLQLAG